MAGEPSSNRSMQGSYVQLSTFDKDNVDGDGKVFLSSEPPKRFMCTKRDTIVVIIALVSTFILITTTLAIGLPKIQEKRQLYLDTSFPVSSSPLKTYSQAAVVTDGEPCAPIGREILQNGGSAVDAAIAALFCNGVVNPQSMGLGGGFLMTIYIKESNVSEVIDAREKAPLGAKKNMFNGNATLSQEGGLSIAVPGELRGYWAAHQKYGKMEWKKLIEPAIKVCDSGFKVTEHLADHLKRLKDRILGDSSMKDEFYNNQTNDLYKEGEILKRPVLSKTLSLIAEKGADVLYTGELNANFLKDIADCGGIINQTDLSGYQPKIRPTVKIEINHPEKILFHSVPPPGSGLILALILNILNGYNVSTSESEDVDKTVLMYHKIVEAFKFAFAHRTQLGDDEFTNITQLVSNLLSKEYAESIRQQISNTQTYPTDFYKPVMETSSDYGTAQVSVLASNGDAVSVTSTVNTYFGSLCRSPSTGIILNNAMDDFSSPNITNYFGVPPSPANYIEPGKRPLSSMCPSILVDPKGDVKMVIGGAGGTRMITASALGMIRMLWLAEDVKKATDAPRFHHQLFPNSIQYEKPFPRIYLDKLAEYGHSTVVDSTASVFLGITRKNDKIETNVDYRKGGSADGF